MRRRKTLTDEVEPAAIHAIEECCQNYGFDVLDLELDINRVHRFVSATPKWAPGRNRRAAQGLALTIDSQLISTTR